MRRGRRRQLACTTDGSRRIASRTTSAIALIAFALATAAAMALISAGFGLGFAWGLSSRRLRHLTPAFGVAGAVFGLWYALVALSLAP